MQNRKKPEVTCGIAFSAYIADEARPFALEYNLTAPLLPTMVAVVAIVGVVFALNGGMSVGSSAGSADKSNSSSKSNDASESNEAKYVETRYVEYDDNGKKLTELTWDLDSSGRVEQLVVTNCQDPKSEQTITYEYDKYGNVTAETSLYEAGDLSHTNTIEYENELDEQNRVVRRVGTSDHFTETSEYEYYGNGELKARHMENVSTAGEQEFKQLVDNEYDEQGRVTHRSDKRYEDGKLTSDSVSEYTWTFDSKGRPESQKVVTTVDGKKTEETLTFECDDAGNILKTFNEAGNLVSESEYTKVNNPLPTFGVSF